MPTYDKTLKYTGIVSLEDTIFEGISRPQAVLSLHEGSMQGSEDTIILERYFTDIQNLFQKKLLIFSSDGDTSGSGQDGAKLRSLLEEMIKVKTLIQKAAL